MEVLKITNSITDLKRKYNALLVREKKAEKFLETATPEQLDKWIPEFNKIVVELSKLMCEIPGITKDEILNGFNGV